MPFIISCLFFLLSIASSFVISQTFNSLSDYQPLHIIDGAGLYQKDLGKGNTAYLQIVDVRKMQIDQIVGGVDKMGLGEGKYYQGEGKYYSPFFQNKLFSKVSDEYQQLYGKQVFSLINCSFFEQYQASTQLSFPIKLNGTVITGGNSPYGPVQQPKDEYYQGVRLQALVWDDQQAYITDYEPLSGKPLREKTVQNAIVTYRYSDHPAKALFANKANRYQLIGTLNQDGVKGDELLLILTVDKATIDEAANLLRQLGVKGEILTFDGGSSTYLFNAQQGNLLIPQLSTSATIPAIRNLPHYLGFRQKSKKQLIPRIFVNQPKGRIELQNNQPYLILWWDNLDGDVTIKLYNGNKFIQDITSRTPSDGVLEWTPRQLLTDSYELRIVSRNYGKILGKLQLFVK
ncbi:MAG TPA: hypothetical protein VK203_08130 [Nostocaceae cyanobacterium]|nr:hypothetical protein [Nostocaceae cyanobacterium]